MKNENKPILYVKRVIMLITFDLIATMFLLYAAGHLLRYYIYYHQYNSLWIVVAIVCLPVRYFLINLIYSVSNAKFYNDYVFFNSKKVMYKDIDFIETSKTLFRDKYYTIKFHTKNKKIRIRVKRANILELRLLLLENGVTII